MSSPKYAYQVNLLWFDDGSLKGLAAFMNLIGLIVLDQQGKFGPDDFAHPRVKTLLESMLEIATIYKSQSESGTFLDSQLARVVKQNQVKQMGDSGKSDGIGFDEALALYNAHPLDATGSGSVKIDNKKANGIRHWMERTDGKALALVESTQHDVPFNMGPFGEALSQISWLFLGSGSPVQLVASANCGLAPLDGEGTVTIDWELPLTAWGQFLLFSRIIADFTTSTSLVEVKSKKKYRAKEADLQQIRNLIAIWTQIRGLCEAKMDVGEFEQKLLKGNHVDDELQEVLLQRPRAFALSMMPAQKERMQKAAESKEQAMLGEVEQQRLEVRHAKFEFLKKALKRDQLQLTRVEAAPAKLAALQSRTEAVWREEQAALGERAVNSWCNKYLRVVEVEKADFATGPMIEYLNFVAKLHNVSVDQIHIVAYSDFNHPQASSKSRVADLARLFQSCCEMNPITTVGVCDFPEVPKASSKRGLADEENDIQVSFWAQKLNIDTRFVVPYDLPPSGEALNKRRRE
eukprot:s4234_g4.t1